MNPKTFTLGPVSYGYNVKYKAWTFKAGPICLLSHCKGAERAHKIAKQVLGAFKRTQGRDLDNTARYHINRIENS